MGDSADQRTSSCVRGAALRRRPYRDRVLRTLRQPRYVALAALMVLVAIVCVGAGTWQIARFQMKVHENDDLRANAHAVTARIDDVLPVVGDAPAPSPRAVEYRTVRVTGHYDEQLQTLVRSRTIGDETGFLIVTPLRTAGPTLLVVRGFAPQPASGGAPKPAAPPPGTVTVTARVQSAETRHDSAAQLTDHQVESINPVEQAPRIGGAVYNGYAQLNAHQPGTAGVRAIPAPSLSNPAGGALEPQHFAYVIQWYLFAMLALGAPLVMARSETKQRCEHEFDDVPATRVGAPVAPVAEPSAVDLRAAKIADRYGRVVRR